MAVTVDITSYIQQIHQRGRFSTFEFCNPTYHRVSPPKHHTENLFAFILHTFFPIFIFFRVKLIFWQDEYTIINVNHFSTAALKCKFQDEENSM